MIKSNDYNLIIKEHFDICDTETRKVLLAVNEADKNEILTSLTSKLYDNIVNKVDDIDYGNIPETRGDITKIDNYDKLVDSIELMEGILVEFKQDLGCIQILKTALGNVLERREMFEKAFKYNVELPMIMYSTITLSIVSSISFLITSCVEFIKSPNQDDFDIAIQKTALAKSKQNLLFRNLDKFNASCSKSQFDTSMNYIIDNNMKGLTGIEPGLMVGGIALVGILLNIIPLLRELIFFFYYSRTRVSDYFDIQADLLQMNAFSIQNNQSVNKKEREEIYKNQMKIVIIFKKISNTFAIETKQIEVKVNKELSNDSKKYKTSDVVDSMPDSAASVLF